MPWAPTILQQFNIHEAHPDRENQLYGPFNMLLMELFPHAEGYQVAPQLKGPFTPGAIDYAIMFLVRKDSQPILFFEIKPFAHLSKISTREHADQQIQHCFNDVIVHERCVIPKLYGISAMGTHLCIYDYEKETNTLSPPLIPHNPTMVNDVAPLARWDLELLEPSGALRFWQIITEVKAMAQMVAVCASSLIIFICSLLTSHPYHYNVVDKGDVSVPPLD